MSSPILPKRRIDVEGQRRLIRQQLAELARDAQKDFAATTKTWKHQPAFAIDSQDTEATVSTSDKVYGFVNDGTRPHVIVAKRGRGLAFGVGSKTKTTPRVIGSGPGSTGSPVIVRPMVRHPGTEAREFAKAIKEKWQRIAAKRMLSVIVKEVRK